MTPLIDRGPRLHVGKLPGKPGVWLYELDQGNVFRALARFDGDAAAERYLKFKDVPNVRNLKEGISCDAEIEGFSDETRGEMMQRRKPIKGSEL